jgi:hypothetical protein
MPRKVESANKGLPCFVTALRLGSVSSSDELAQLWTIDKSAYGEASLTYEQFAGWWCAYPSGLLVLHWDQRIGGAIGLRPLSGRAAARFTNGKMKEANITGRMMHRFRQIPAHKWYISGMVLRPDLSGTCSWQGNAIAAVLNQWRRPLPKSTRIPLALSPWPESELLLGSFGFYCCQKAHAMPDGFALYALDVASRDDFASLLQARLDRE